jgi:hypothetical protein
LVGCAGLKAGHVFVERVAFILAAYHFGHALQGFLDLRFASTRDVVGAAVLGSWLARISQQSKARRRRDQRENARFLTGR